MSQIPDSYVLLGGVDLVTPAQNRHPGSLLGAVNYEPAKGGGYSRIEGYERFDGRSSPSNATYAVLNFDSGDNEPNVGDDILGGTSAATGEILAVVVESGSWAGSDAVGYLVITKVSGTWADDENIRDSGDSLTIAVANGELDEEGVVDDDDNNTYIAAARESYRVDIGTITGSGDIRGIHIYNGSVYAFRDNAGATAGTMWKATSSGWIQVTDIGGNLAFDTGTTAEPSPGATITGGTSGATGIYMGHAEDSGDWSANTMTGIIYIRTISGTFQTSETISWTGGSANTTAVNTDSIPAGGKYEFLNYNFKGQSGDILMFGVNGVGQGFVFDGTGLCMINTGMTSDIPSHVHAHHKHLFFSFGSSIQHSSIGNPYEWSAITGAAEIATGDTVTGFLTVPGNALAVFDRNSTYILYGTSSADWELSNWSNESGAIEWTCQNMGSSRVYFDDRGISRLDNVASYGDFKSSTLSQLVEPVIQLKKGSINDSIRIREKDQYRLFFNDNTGLIMRGVGKKATDFEFTFFEYPVEVKCTCSMEDGTGEERLFFGSDDGYVYEMDKGQSFDGDDIEYRMRLSFYGMGYPRNRKRFFKAIFDIDNTDIPDLSFFPDFAYGDPHYAISTAASISDTALQKGGGLLDEYDYYGQFYWDGMIVGQAEAPLKGSGINLSLTVTGSSNYEAVHRIHGVTIHFGIRGLKI